MLSDLIDVLGLAAIVAGVFVLAGLGFALLTGGAVLMFVARAVDDAAANRALSRVLRAARRVVTAPARVRRPRRRRAKTQAA